jgi:alkaline phosphatase
MVEGSQIDWAAHHNDPYAAVTDFLEFDKAVAVAVAFAKKDRNTMIIICPDHGSGGISLGTSIETVFSEKTRTNTENLDIKKDIVEPLQQIKCSARKLAEMMLKNHHYISKDSIAKYYNFHPTDSFISVLEYLIKERKNIDSVEYLLGINFSLQNHIGWTTTKHTGEDVFLGIYAPDKIKKKTGVIDNSDVGKYIAKTLNLMDFDEATQYYYVKHTDLFPNAVATSDNLTIEQNGTKVVVFPNTNVLKYGETIMLTTRSAAIYVNGYYYLPYSILRYFE